MSASWYVLLLRFIHVLSAIFWVGGAWIVTGFILPTVRALGPAGGAVMTELTRVRKLPLRVLIAGWVAVLSGALLYAHNESSSSGTYHASPAGRGFATGAALGIVVILMGTFANMPTTRRMGVIAAEIAAAGGAPDPARAAELQRLQTRLKRLMQAASILLGFAAAAMATARYWP